MFEIFLLCFLPFHGAEITAPTTSTLKFSTLSSVISLRLSNANKFKKVFPLCLSTVSRSNANTFKKVFPPFHGATSTLFSTLSSVTPFDANSTPISLRLSNANKFKKVFPPFHGANDFHAKIFNFIKRHSRRQYLYVYQTPTSSKKFFYHFTAPTTSSFFNFIKRHSVRRQYLYVYQTPTCSKKFFYHATAPTSATPKIENFKSINQHICQKFNLFFSKN